jgi:type II secretory pathway pseudopilin PulG
MKKLIKKNMYPLIMSQRGTTLVELLAAITIFIVILLPLSSVYVKGVSLYQQTEEQTSLRNEADFLLSDILNTVQNASYFELTSTPDDHTLYTIFSNQGVNNLVQGEDENTLKGGVMIYTRSTKYSNDENTTTYSLTRNTYQWAPHNHKDKVFNYDEGSYMAYGLFKTTEDNRKLIIYLLITPGGNSPITRDGLQTHFNSLTDVLDEINRLGPNQHSPYIYVVRTEFTVNNLTKG